MKKTRTQTRPPVAAVRRDSSPKTDVPSQQANQLFLQGNGHYDRAAFAEAIACYQQAVQLAPRSDVIYCNLGSAYWAIGQRAAAMQAWQQAVTLNPKALEAHNNLGNGYTEEGLFTEARDSYQRALNLNPNLHAIHNNLAGLLTLQGQLSEAYQYYRRAMELDGNSTLYHSNYLLDLNYCDSTSDQELLAAHQRYGQRFTSVQSGPIEWPRGEDPERPLRVGYVSGDFYESSIGFLIEPILVHHQRDQFTPVCYSTGRRSDQVTVRLRDLAAQWRDVRGLDFEALAQQIRADRIDILVDMIGHTTANRLPTFARKPAPVQISYAGYINTTGLQAMDYYVGDEVTLPPGSERWFAERLLRLPPGLYCYQVPDYTPEVAPLPALTSGRITFASFNKVAKLTPFILNIWCQLLLAVAGSRLIIKDKSVSDAATCQRLMDFFASRGVVADRLELRRHTALKDHLADYGQVDIALDPHPFNGGITTLQALWQGVPVISLLGSRHASRVGASLAVAVGLDDLTVARSSADYVAKGVTLASDLPRLMTIRAGLRDRMRRTAMIDGARFTGHWERLLRTTWHHHCAAKNSDNP
ncbi:MAG: tetratricopeptide repeat protein [Magnetococcales bacterium]|nr:tetratricopeptide repeat protein [Magnetococcales bacterium]